MLERWAFDREMLKRFSKHYLTGERISDEMIDTLIGINKD
jgi:Zn-dependent oligopeptidase